MIGSHLLLELVFGRSTGYKFFNAVMLLLFLALIPIMGILGVSAFTYREIASEINYRRLYGENWKARYEEQQGSLTKAHTRLAIVVPGTALLGIAYVYAYKQIVPALRGPQPRRDRHRRRTR